MYFFPNKPLMEIAPTRGKEELPSDKNKQEELQKKI